MNNRFYTYQAAMYVIIITTNILLIAPVFLNPTLAISPDNYLDLAQEWRQTGIFPDSYFGPLYIAYIALFLGITNNIPFIILSQLFLSIATAYIVYRIAWYSTENQFIATIATALWLLLPLRIIYQGMVLTETLYIFLMYLGILLSFNSKNGLSLAFSGITFSLAALTRGNSLIIGAMLFLYLLSSTGIKQIRPYIYIIFFTIPILIWSWNNYIQYHSFKPTASGDYNIAALIIGYEKRASMGLPQVGNADVWKLPGEVFANTFEEGKSVKERALFFAYYHPYEILRSNIIGWIRSITGSGFAQWQLIWGDIGTIIAILGSVFRVSIFAVSLSWLSMSLIRYRSITKPNSFLVFIYAVSFFAHVIPAGASGYSRFSLPVDPIAIIIAVVAIKEIFVNSHHHSV